VIGRPSISRVGFTLVEVVVALVLLELMLLGTLAILHRATGAATRAVVTEVAVWEATAVADSAVGSADVARGWGGIEWTPEGVVARDSLGDTLVALRRGRW